jgi:hypothetical protein
VSTTTFGAVARTQFSGALLRGDGGKCGPALLDVLAVAVRALHLTFFVIHERQNLVEEFLAVTAEEFVVRHTHLHSAEKGDGRILDHWVGRFNMGSGHEFCVGWSRVFPEVWVADSA